MSHHSGIGHTVNPAGLVQRAVTTFHSLYHYPPIRTSQEPPAPPVHFQHSMQNDSGMPKSGLPDTFPRLPISPGESSARPHLGLQAHVAARRPPPTAVTRPPARALATAAAAALRVTPPRGVCRHHRGPLSAPCSASFSCRHPSPPYLFILSPQNASAPSRRRFRRELGGQPGPGQEDARVPRTL